MTVRSPLPGGAAAAVKASEQKGDRAIDLSESAAATAHRLAEFEARFGPHGEAQLSQAERDALWQLRKRHATRLNRSLDALAALLPDTEGAPPAAEERSTGGAPPVDALVKTAAEVDRLVTALYAGPRPGVGAAAPGEDLLRKFSQLRTLSRQYSAWLGQSMESEP